MRKQGKIIKGIAGFYYVLAEENLYECKAKGIFRNKNMKPLVGDNVIIDIIDEVEKTGNIIQIDERKNELIRPVVSNIDQAMLVFALKYPNPNLNLLDKFLVMMEFQNIRTILCFNKKDIADETNMKELKEIYQNAGYEVVFASATEKEGMETVKKLLKNKTTVLAGPSGVGKSSILNALTKDGMMETGSVSGKIGRGKHTTRHSQLFEIENHTFVFDTPGFSSLFVPGMSKEKLEDCFPEFDSYKAQCRFIGCAHINEPDCAVKEAFHEGKIPVSRYENYKMMYQELKEKEKRYD